MTAIKHNHWIRVARSYFVDGFIMVVAFLGGSVIRLGPGWSKEGYDFLQMLTLAVELYWPGMLLGALFFPSCVYVCGLYSPRSFHSGIFQRFLILAICLILTFWVLLAFFYLNFSTRIGRGVMIFTILISTVLVVVHHIHSTIRRRHYRERSIILNMPQMDTFTAEMIDKFLGHDLKFCGFVLKKRDFQNFNSVEDLPVLGTMEQLEEVVELNDISRILCNAEDLSDPRYYRAFCNMRYRGIDVIPLLQHCEEVHQYVPLNLVTNEWLLSASSMPHRLYIRKLKRGSDIAFSLLLLVLMSPVILLTTLGVLLTSGRPILYTQDRIGRFGRTFKVAKFRSMRKDAEKHGAQWSSAKGDSRVTLLGGVLRKYRIDELPQLLNILSGDMSFVGPRPERPEFVQMLNEKLVMNPERLMIQPGLTGWAQVNYPYGASVEDAARKLEYDLYYMKHMSLFLDLFIILDTVRTVLMGGAKLEETARHNRYFLAALNVPGKAAKKHLQKKPPEERGN